MTCKIPLPPRNLVVPSHFLQKTGKFGLIRQKHPQNKHTPRFQNFNGFHIRDHSLRSCQLVSTKFHRPASLLFPMVRKQRKPRTTCHRRVRYRTILECCWGHDRAEHDRIPLNIRIKQNSRRMPTGGWAFVSKECSAQRHTRIGILTVTCKVTRQAVRQAAFLPRISGLTRHAIARLLSLPVYFFISRFFSHLGLPRKSTFVPGTLREVGE
jgi:hypothetical protein